MGRCDALDRRWAAVFTTSLAALLASALADEQWEVELLRRPDGSLGGVLARARDPRHAMAGRVFACKGAPFGSEADLAAYIASATSPAR